jgi:hypothetical protein
MTKYTLIILFLMPLNLTAATYIPLSLEHQLRDASGVIRAVYNGSQYKKGRQDRVITEASFRIKTMAGLKNHEVINKNSFKVIYPGGKWQGVTYQVTGSPTFEKDEEVILLITKTSAGFVPTNLALGKYKIKKEFGKEYISSVIFPNNNKLSSIPLSKFNNLISDNFGTTLENISPDKFVFKGKTKNTINKRGRKPANLEESEPTTKDQGGIIWPIVLLAFLGFYSAYITKQHHKK